MRPCRLLLSHCKRMGMSQIHNFSFMGWRSHSPNIPCLTGVQPGASPSPDKVIKKTLETASRWIKTFPWSKCRFFFFFLLLQAGAGARKPRKREKNAIFFSCHRLQAARPRSEQGRGHTQPPKDPATSTTTSSSGIYSHIAILFSSAS